MPPGRPQVITLTATSGASYLYRSADSGKTWRMATYFDGGLGFRDLAYVSATTGYLIHINGWPGHRQRQGADEDRERRRKLADHTHPLTPIRAIAAAPAT